MAASRVPWRCRLGWHSWEWVAANIAGHQSWSERQCVRCDDRQVQPRTWSMQPDGPWQHWNTTPCTHGVGGVAIDACIQCARARALVRR